MPYQEFQQKIQIFKSLMESLAQHPDRETNALIKRYLEQNILVLNEIFASSIANLQRFQKAQNIQEVFASQGRFSNEVTKKLAQSANRFLNVSLGQVADYNEWLRAHCDLATD